jgi:hypothetical protein
MLYADTPNRSSESRFNHWRSLRPSAGDPHVTLIVPPSILLPLGHYAGVEQHEDQIGVHTAVAAEADYYVTAKQDLVGRTFVNPATQTTVLGIGWEELVALTDVGGFNLEGVSPGAW